MDNIEAQHRQELIEVRARLYELQRREHELVVVLNTFSAIRPKAPPIPDALAPSIEIPLQPEVSPELQATIDAVKIKEAPDPSASAVPPAPENPAAAA